MGRETVVKAGDGVAFEDGDDSGRILISARETDGRYSLMEYRVAARPTGVGQDLPNFGAHRHNDIEETFLVRRGRLRFLLGQDVFDLQAGDFVRVPPGLRHGYANLSGENVELLVGFHPGGFEELFVIHRTDQNPPPSPTGFLEDATLLFASEFEV